MRSGNVKAPAAFDTAVRVAPVFAFFAVTLAPGLLLYVIALGLAPELFLKWSLAWIPPAVVAHAPRAAAGVQAAKLTTTRRADNTRQLVYNGHPLYAMVGDTRPGQTQGQAFVGTWFVVSPAGHLIGHPSRSAGY